MNQNSDKSEGIVVLSLLALVFLLAGIWFIKDDIAGVQKIILTIDYYIVNILPFLKIFIVGNKEEVMYFLKMMVDGAPLFNNVSYDVLNNEYYNIYENVQYDTFNKIYRGFYYINSILISFLMLPLTFQIWRLYSKKIIKFNIKKPKEEVYPGMVDNKRRNSKNKVFEVMDYFPPIITNSEDEFISGSIRLSKKAMDSSWMEIQKEKLKEKAKEISKYDYLKLTYLDKYYIRNIDDKELLDYIKILRYKDKKPERNTKKENRQLPKKLTKENYKEVINILESNLIEHDKNIEYGRLLMPAYYIFTPLENKKMKEFTCAGAKELINILSKYVVDDFKKEVNKTISELKKENKKLEKDGDSESLETIKQNLNLVIEMENMLNPEFNNSRNQKILNLATIHQYEETFLMAMLIYGRQLVNLPIGVLAKMKYKNSVLWYALTSIGRTYQYKAGLPLAILYQIEKEEAESREKEKLDIDTIDPESMISDNVKDEINDAVGDQYEGGKAFNTKRSSIRSKIKRRPKQTES